MMTYNELAEHIKHLSDADRAEPVQVYCFDTEITYEEVEFEKIDGAAPSLTI